MSDYRVVVILPGEERAAGGGHPLVEFSADGDDAAIAQLVDEMSRRREEAGGTLARHNGGPADANESWEFIASRWGGPTAVVMMANGSTR